MEKGCWLFPVHVDQEVRLKQAKTAATNITRVEHLARFVTVAGRGVESHVSNTSGLVQTSNVMPSCSASLDAAVARQCIAGSSSCRVMALWIWHRSKPSQYLQEWVKTHIQLLLARLAHLSRPSAVRYSSSGGQAYYRGTSVSPAGIPYQSCLHLGRRSRSRGFGLFIL